MAEEKRQYTPAQSAAIEERRKTLLISAAAGSGKTATLTERVIRSLCDAENPVDISRMLIVTFTRAAAAEMRDRIEAALLKALKNDPQNKRLLRQLLLLPGAKISTIDAFCTDVTRRGAATLGISPTFRIADESERVLLAYDVLNDLIDECYDGAYPAISAEDFEELAESVTGVRDEARLADVFFDLAKKMAGFAEGVSLLRDRAERFSAELRMPLDETRAAKSAVAATERFLLHYIKIWESFAEARLLFDGKAEKYLPLLDAELSGLHALLSAAKNGYVALSAAVSSRGISFARMPSVKKDGLSPEALEYAALRKQFKEEYQDICKDYFAFSAENIKEALEKTVRFEEGLARFFEEYERRFRARKTERGVCDFEDVERYALQLLVKDGKPTPLAKSLSKTYDYIYIDEFQDTNSLQDAIFRAIARKDNLFMVGDVKQSIYSFRNAEPAIFASYKKAFLPLREAENASAASIFMSQNFRSDTAVIDFTNRIFDTVFAHAGASIAYTADDRLEYAKRKPEVGAPTEVWLFDGKPRDGEEEMETGDRFIDTDTDEEDDSDDLDGLFDTPDVLDAEAVAVAREIHRLIREERLDNGSPIKPSDIAILLRGNRADAFLFAEAIRREGIPASSESDVSFFLNPEIMLVLSLLNVIDNPYRDIPLAALLRSPLYRFTMDELVRIRMAKKDGGSLYEALCLYAEGAADAESREKAKAFLSELRSFRRMAEGVPVDRLLRRLYNETGLLSVSQRGEEGRQRRAHLFLLYQYARRFEASSFRGLYNFISYVNTVIREEREVSELSSSDEDLSAVKIVTIHHSKGLEFPVCFLCRASKGYNERDNKQALLFHKDYGAVTRFHDETGLARVGNLFYRAVSRELTCLGREEEMRVLYVALTRARERLYVTAKARDGEAADKLLERGTLAHKYMSPYLVYSMNNYASLVLSTVTGNEPYVRLTSFPYEELSAEKTMASDADGDGQASVDEGELRRRFSFRYPYAAVSEMPSKLSVSRLYPTVLDDTGDDGETLFGEEAETAAASYRLPSFATERGEADAARRGTATHLFMQFCDYGRLVTHTAAEELSRLVSDRFITEADADLVFLEEIEAFRRSELLKTLLSAKSLHRELRFHASLPAERFTAEEGRRAALRGEYVFVQGVMDCVAVEENGDYVLVDYKTDRLTPYEKTHKEAARKKLCARHREQLSYYASAATEIFGRPPRAVLIYSLPLADTVEVKVNTPSPLL